MGVALPIVGSRLAALLVRRLKPNGNSMTFRKNITVRVLVWLTALLLPAEAMPGYNCGCMTNGAAAVQVHARPCCGKAGKRCCCGKVKGLGCCCCSKGKNRSASSCQCAKGGPARDQAPASTSQDGTAKTLAAAHVSPALAADAISAVPPPATHLLFLPAQTSLERLSTLCRLVV
jgi:hypothetical protein